MAVSILNQWQGTAADQDAELVTNPTAGNTLICTIAARVVDGSAPLLSLGDVSRNVWTLLADNTKFASSANGSAQLQTEIWACPSARFDGWPWLLTYAAAMQITAPDVGSVTINVFEIAALPGDLTVDSVTLNTASASTTLGLTVPAPTGSANCLMVAAAVSDTAAASTPSGTGWTALTGVTNTNPVLGMGSAWREATTGGTVTFTGSSASWAGVAVAIKTAGTAIPQPNAAWPATRLQVGLGYDLSTPLSRVRWTDQTTRYLSLDGGPRGIQAELGTAQQAQAALSLRNDDGAYTPRPVALSASANAAGTTTTIKIADANATAIHLTDYFRLKTSTGALKELNVFQVTGLSSSGGTTTVTFTRADGTGGGALASTASGDIYAGIAIDLYIPWRLLKTVAGTTYCVDSGWIGDLDIVFDDAHHATFEGTGTDILEGLSSVDNPSALRGEIYRRTSLYAYWPLDDASGTGYAANQSGVSNAVLTQTVSKYGTGANQTADFGASTQDIDDADGNPNTLTSLLGDPATGWAQDGLTSAELATKGYALVGSDPSMPSITNGVTIFGAYSHTYAQLNVITGASVDPTLFILRNTDPALSVGQGSIIKVSIQHTAPTYPIVTRWDKSTHATTSTVCSSNSFLGGPWGFWALTFNQTSWAMYVDGGLSGSGSCNLVSSFSGIDFMGEADQFFHGRFVPGTTAHVGIFGRRLTAGEISRLANSTTFGRFATSTETSSVRIQKKLGYAAWRNPRALNASTLFMAAEAAPSGSVADLASDVVGQEDSLFFADAASQVQYRNRVTAYNQYPRAVLGDGPGELPYQAGGKFGLTRVFLYNSTTIVCTTTGGYSQLSVNTFIAVDDTSAGRYGARTLSKEVRYASTFNAWDIGWWLLARYAYPQNRLPAVTVSAKASNDTASSSGRWAFVCGVEVGDIVTVNRRPIQNGQPTVSIRCRVLQVQPIFEYGANQVTGDVTLTLGTAPPIVPIANDATYGTIGGTVVGA